MATDKYRAMMQLESSGTTSAPVGLASSTSAATVSRRLAALETTVRALQMCPGMLDSALGIQALWPMLIARFALVTPHTVERTASSDVLLCRPEWRTVRR
jgi:hypothetical protein